MLIVILFFIIGSIFLQVYLSKKENKYLGLILPFITFVISIMAVLGDVTVTQIVQDERIIVNTIKNLNLFTGLFSLILYNGITGILLGIYIRCRKRMNIKNI